MAKLLANTGDSDQTHSVASDLDLHCLRISLLNRSEENLYSKTPMPRTPMARLP